MKEIRKQYKGVLYVIACAGSPAQRVQDLVHLAQAARWDVCVIGTPQSATKFLRISLLEELTGHPVRSDYKQPETPDVLPPADAMIVAPATFNTINKIAFGIADTLAVSLLSEGIGRRLPIVVDPVVNREHLGRHPLLPQTLTTLREWGVHVIFEPEKYQPRNEVPWEIILEALHQIMDN